MRNLALYQGFMKVVHFCGTRPKKKYSDEGRGQKSFRDYFSINFGCNAAFFPLAGCKKIRPFAPEIY